VRAPQLVMSSAVVAENEKNQKGIDEVGRWGEYVRASIYPQVQPIISCKGEDARKGKNKINGREKKALYQRREGARGKESAVM